MKEKFDQEVKEQLHKGTEYPNHIKEDIWNKIEQRIDNQQNSATEKAKKTKKSIWFKLSRVGPIAAALLLVVMIFSTETGNAFINNVKELFVPEKVVKEQIEGIESESNVTIQEGNDYVIYFDQESYSMIKVDGKDRIIFNQELSDIYPDVYMEISQTYENPQEVVKQIQKQLQSEFVKVSDIMEVQDPLESFMVYAIGGTGGYEWDDPYVRYYVFSNEKEGSFIVQQQFFLEAEEGHGVRFDLMLEEFYLIEQ